MPDRDAENPATTSQEHAMMSARWAKMATVLAGTEAMREAASIYLPQHEHESDNNWRTRLSTAVLFNVTQLTLDTLVGRPFSDRVMPKDDVPTAVSDLFDDMDLQGNDLHTFSRSVFEDGFAKGFTHVMVEFPRVRYARTGPEFAHDGDALRHSFRSLVHRNAGCLAVLGVAPQTDRHDDAAAAAR